MKHYTSTTSGDGSFTHLNYLSYYNLLINACVRYDATNTSTPSKRRNVYVASGTQDFSIIEDPHETQFSQDIDTPSDDFYQVHQTKHNKKPSKPLSVFQRDHAKKTTPSAPKKLLKNMMVLSMFLQKFSNSSALKLLLPSRNTILRPSTNLPRKEVYMSLTLLTMNYTHLRIPILRNNMTLINLMMPLTVRVIQFWITSTANTTKRKT